MASLGYAGVNLHGGEGKMVADSLGGSLPGEALMKDPTVPHPRPFYTPIADIGSEYVAEPVSYGMRFAQQFAGATMIPVDFDPGPVNATAYAALAPEEALARVAQKDPAKMRDRALVAIINKDATQELRVKFPGALIAVDTVSAESLSATKVVEGQLPLLPGVERTVPPHSMAIFRLQLVIRHFPSNSKG